MVAKLWPPWIKQDVLQFQSLRCGVTSFWPTSHVRYIVWRVSYVWLSYGTTSKISLAFKPESYGFYIDGIFEPGGGSRGPPMIFTPPMISSVRLFVLRNRKMLPGFSVAGNKNQEMLPGFLAKISKISKIVWHRLRFDLQKVFLVRRCFPKVCKKSKLWKYQKLNGNQWKWKKREKNSKMIEMSKFHWGSFFSHFEIVKKNIATENIFVNNFSTGFKKFGCFGTGKTNSFRKI